MLIDTFVLMAGACALDRCLGDPRRYHPVAGFGRYASAVETLCRRLTPRAALPERLLGLTAWALAVLPPTLIVAALAHTRAAGLSAMLCLYVALGGRSLAEHGSSVARRLEASDLDGARQALSLIVSRDTRSLDAAQISAATVESMLENGNDAVFAALFWFAVGGAPGVVLYRAVNTLDAMWGYRNTRYRYFGWAAARLDDLMNYVPARLTALSYALLGQTGSALRCWRRQAPAWDSPNAGPVMAAGAGALAVQLGGPAVYFGRLESRPALGCGAKPAAADIGRAVRLVRRGVRLWVGLFGLAALLAALLS